MPTLSGSLNVTGSVNVTGSFTLNGNIVTSGTITSNGPNTFNGNVIVTGSLTATGGVTASLQGSASYAENSTYANNIQITNITSSGGGPFYPVFTATSNGYGSATVDTSIFIYTPTTNTLTVNIAGNVTGSLTGSLLGSLIGTSSYATRAVTSDKLKTANIAGGGTFYPLIGSNYTGDVDVYAISSTNYKYDLGINQLIVSSISASFTGSLLGTGSYALRSLSASYAPVSSAFPYTGNALISGSLVVTGGIALASTNGNGTISPNLNYANIYSQGAMHIKDDGAYNNRYYVTNPAGTSETRIGIEDIYMYNSTDSAEIWLAGFSGNTENTLYFSGAANSVVHSDNKLRLESTRNEISGSSNSIVGSLGITGSVSVRNGDITVTPLSATTKIAITDGFMKNEMKKTSTVIANQASPYNISLGSYVYDPVSSPFFPVSNAIYSTGATDLLISSTQKLNIEATSTVISSSLSVSGSTTIDNILTLVPRTTTPTGIASGSIIVSGSATGIKPYFWNGLVWTALF